MFASAAGHGAYAMPPCKSDPSRSGSAGDAKGASIGRRDCQSLQGRVQPVARRARRLGCSQVGSNMRRQAPPLELRT